MALNGSAHPSSRCVCPPPFHLLRCPTVAEPLRRYAEVEAEAWAAYALQTSDVRRAYAEALYAKKRIFNQTFKQTKQSLGRKMSLYEMVSRADEIMAPAMRAYLDAVNAEREAYWKTVGPLQDQYGAKVDEARATLERALVFPEEEVRADPQLHGLDWELVRQAPPLPKWLPGKLRPASRPASRDDDSGKFLTGGVKAMAVVMVIFAGYLVVRAPTGGETWPMVGLLVGAAMITGSFEASPKPLRLGGSAVMAAGGLTGLALGGPPAPAIITLVGAGVFAVFFWSFGRMMRGFPSEETGRKPPAAP